MTQSGVQVVYGGGTVSEAMKESKSEEKNEDSVGTAPLVGGALIAVVGAVVFSLLALFVGGKLAGSMSSLLPAVALVLLSLQLMMGFPVEKKLSESMAESSDKTQNSEDGFSAFGASMASAMIMNIRVQKTQVFYFELIALGIPTLLLLNGLIDKHKKP